MTLQTLKDTVVAELRRVTTWVNATLVAMLPFSADIMNAVNTNLPNLAPYLPENIYKAVGFAAVVYNMAASVRRTHRE
jgi:hypothetical protein